MRFVTSDGRNFGIEYTPEELADIARHKRNLRLRLAREAMIQATEYYASLRALEGERQREEESVN